MVIDSIRTKLTAEFTPEALDIVDESHKHAGHRGLPADASGETHFAVTLVSAKFEGISRVGRHQLVYHVLAEELNHPVHALALKTLTPAEYRALCS